MAIWRSTTERKTLRRIRTVRRGPGGRAGRAPGARLGMSRDEHPGQEELCPVLRWGGNASRRSESRPLRPGTPLGPTPGSLLG